MSTFDRLQVVYSLQKFLFQVFDKLKASLSEATHVLRISSRNHVCYVCSAHGDPVLPFKLLSEDVFSQASGRFIVGAK
jgi:hypothetical protein